MRGVIFITLLLLIVWALLLIRLSASDFNFAACRAICNMRGRELASIEPSFVTKCNCGERKRAPKRFDRP